MPTAIALLRAVNLGDENVRAKYRFTPKGPIIIEIFQNHEDFAVRTLGIPGLGALGVCFGFVVAQDSPAARVALRKQKVLPRTNAEYGSQSSAK